MLERCLVKDKDKDKRRVKGTLSKALNAERSASLPRKGDAPGDRAQEPTRKERETAFLAEVRALCESVAPGAGERELANWGGWWRLRFRKDPRKARAVLADIRLMSREGRLHGPPGPAAVDLWNRLP
jgi:hypothetical protein